METDPRMVRPKKAYPSPTLAPEARLHRLAQEMMERARNPAYIALLDLDGTLADTKHRAHYVEGEQRDWDSFFRPDLVLRDPPLPHSQQGVGFLAARGIPLFFLSGRNESLREASSRWLSYHYGIRDNPGGLLLRALDDKRPALEYKLEQVERIRKLAPPQVRFLFFEDDSTLFEPYEKLGRLFRAPGCWADFWLTEDGSFTR